MNNDILQEIESLEKDDIFSVRKASFLTDNIIRVSIEIHSVQGFNIVKYYSTPQNKNNNTDILVNITEDVMNFIKNSLNGNQKVFLSNHLSEQINIYKSFEVDS